MILGDEVTGKVTVNLKGLSYEDAMQLIAESKGYAYWALDKRQEAEEAFRAALQMDPKLVPSHFWLGVVLEKDGRKDEAKAHFQAARDLEPASMLGKRAAEVLKAMGDGS